MSEHAVTDRVLADRYRVGELLGRGGMADVYDAVDGRLGRPVAVKILRPAMVARHDVRRRFEDEARAAARLSHPNVVAVFDTGEDEGVPWIVMERLSGETLADKMAAADGPLPTAWVVRVAGDVLDALAAAHAAGIIHRDVKPGNILFSDEGNAKVADFGIAKSVEAMGDATTAGVLLGTPRYLSPERVTGEPSTTSSDIYALGVVLYEALTGRPAFAGDTPVATAYNVQHAPPPSLAAVRPDVPLALTHAVDKAMARQPDERFATAGEFAAALREPGVVDLRDGADPTVAIAGAAWAAGSPDPTQIAAAAAAAPAPSASSRLSRGRQVWIAIALALVFLLLLAGVLASRGLKDAAGSGSATSTTAQPSPLSTDLRTVAARLDPGHDGPAAPAAASGLRAIADKLDAGQDAGSDATALALKINTWHDDRQLFDTAAGLSLDVLSRVPGFDAAAATTTTTAAKGRGRKHKREDD